MEKNNIYERVARNYKQTQAWPKNQTQKNALHTHEEGARELYSAINRDANN